MRPYFLLLLAALMSMAPPAGARDIVRQERTVKVGGVTETWRLVWTGTPKETCGIDDSDGAMTCPCYGIAYGETGDLALVRSRNGKEVERIDMAGVFTAGGDLDGPEKPFLQRWPTRESDWKYQPHDPKLAAAIRNRPMTDVMPLADYDRDGHATEFLVMVGTVACGHHGYVAVGVTPGNAHLHILTTTERPDHPLVMDLPQWQALEKAAAPVTVTFWACGDHGSDQQDDFILHADRGRIHVTERELSCPEGRTQTLLATHPWVSGE